MQILTADQIRAWDQYTITHEPIRSIDLMERAAKACFDWLMKNSFRDCSFSIFCGKGNNGGDGLAIARMLANSGHRVTVYILEFGHLGTGDFQTNLSLIHREDVTVKFVSGKDTLPDTVNDDVAIDALLGSGLNRALDGLTEELVNFINRFKRIISIDIPTGLFADRSSRGNTAVQATYTLSFQCYKPAFLVAENEKYFGKVFVLDIGLHGEYLSTIQPSQQFIDLDMARRLFKPRSDFSHKGKFGHALLIAGSFGKIGAAVLAARACLRTGVGLVTVHLPRCGYSIMQTALPEAMVESDENESYCTSVESLEKYSCIAIGPGIGTHHATLRLVQRVISEKKSVVLDADALNLISELPDYSWPRNAIITPHPKEFDRLFGNSVNDFARIEKAKEKSKELGITIILKGHHTVVATPFMIYFNSSGNSGLAKGGSGDVLTGMVIALVAQGYNLFDAALLAVYLHGRAADAALNTQSKESMIASDVIESIGTEFMRISEAGNQVPEFF